MAAISDNVLEHEHVHCLFPTDLLFSLPCNRWNRKEQEAVLQTETCSNSTKLTIDDLFYDLSCYEREMMSHEEFSFWGEEGGEGGILLKAQFLLQVSYKKMKEYSKVLLCKGKT